MHPILLIISELIHMPYLNFLNARIKLPIVNTNSTLNWLPNLDEKLQISSDLKKKFLIMQYRLLRNNTTCAFDIQKRQCNFLPLRNADFVPSLYTWEPEIQIEKYTYLYEDTNVNRLTQSSLTLLKNWGRIWNTNDPKFHPTHNQSNIHIG